MQVPPGGLTFKLVATVEIIKFEMINAFNQQLTTCNQNRNVN